MKGLRVLRQTMPQGGWPSAVCEDFRLDHSGHGWLRAGQIYWCGPAACRAARKGGGRV